MDNVKAEIRAKLLSIGIKFPKIIDVDWRLDYVLQGNNLGKVNAVMYFVNLKTLNEEGQIENKEFACTLEELKDLQSKVHNAVTQVDRVIESMK